MGYADAFAIYVILIKEGAEENQTIKKTRHDVARNLADLDRFIASSQHSDPVYRYRTEYSRYCGRGAFVIR